MLGSFQVCNDRHDGCIQFKDVAADLQQLHRLRLPSRIRRDLLSESIAGEFTRFESILQTAAKNELIDLSFTT